jgi:integrase
VPAERMKGRKEHRVPLSTRAMAILREMEEVRLSEFVFPSVKQGRPLSDMGIRALVSELAPGITRHGFRSTFRDWAAETTSFQNIVVEMALAHTVTDAVEAAYRRGDLLEKRRELMNAWDRYCERTLAEVVPLKRPAIASDPPAGASQRGTS